MRLRIAIAAAVALAALSGMIAIGIHWFAGTDARGARLPFATTRTAPAPFATFDDANVAVGGRCVRVLVASTLAQRNRGLRDVRDLGPYAGMLFVFPAEVHTRFTMANTPTPLDITFFAANGTPVDRTRMTPCPNGTDATCPTYASKRAYRYALERPAGATGGGGSIGPCSGASAAFG